MFLNHNTVLDFVMLFLLFLWSWNLKIALLKSGFSRKVDHVPNSFVDFSEVGKKQNVSRVP